MQEAEDIDELVSLPEIPAAAPGAAVHSPVAPAPPDAAQAAAVAELRRQALIQCPLLDKHALRAVARRVNVTSASARARTRAITQAVLSLDGQLPISWQSSVHVAVDETRLDVFRVLILPEQDTPYANGAFLFDFLLPETFPEKPPQVRATSSASILLNVRHRWPSRGYETPCQTRLIGRVSATHCGTACLVFPDVCTGTLFRVPAGAQLQCAVHVLE